MMALIANLPFAVAPGMGLNAFFVVAATAMGYTWEQALTAVLFSGLLFVLLSVSPARERVLREVPRALQCAVCAGVGLMIASIGLTNSGVVVHSGGFPALGDLSQGAPRLAVIGLFVTAVLLALKLRFAILGGIIITTLIGLPLGATDAGALKGGLLSLPPSPWPIVFKFDFSVLGSLDFWSVVVAFLFMEVVDSLSGFLGLFGVMGEEGDRHRPRMGRAFIADSLGVVVGSLIGLSPNTAYAESGSGVAAGGRTGLTALVVAGAFLAAMFAAPLFLMTPFAAVAPALVVVGWLMLATVTRLDFKDATEAFPAVAALVLIALTWRISDSLGLAWLLYMLMKICAGRGRELTAAVWVIGLIFAANLVL
jgi:AGZA family xanthine/uracil permease-like MFS transporter